MLSSSAYYVKIGEIAQGFAAATDTGTGQIVTKELVASATSDEDAVRQALGQTNTTLSASGNGTTATYDKDGPHGPLKFLHAGDTGRNVAGGTSSNEDPISAKGPSASQWIIAFEDGIDNDYNDAYFMVYLEKSETPDCDCDNPGSPSASAGNSGSDEPSRDGDGGGGVDMADGSAKVSGPSLQTPGFGTPWGQTPTFTNNDMQLVSGGGTAGNGMVVGQYARLQHSGTSVVQVIVNAGTSLWFDNDGSGYTGKYFVQDKLVETGAGTSADEFAWTDTAGNTTRFYGFSSGIASALQGTFKSFADAAGNQTYVAGYDGSNRMTDVLRVQGSGATARVEDYHYDYDTSGRITDVLYRRGTGDPQSSGFLANATNWATVRELDSEYYDGTTYKSNGNAGDLRLLTLKDGSNNVLDQDYYRWYTPTSTNGASISNANATTGTSTATISISDNGLAVGDLVTISGSSASQLNGDFRVTAATSTSFSVTVYGSLGQRHQERAIAQRGGRQRHHARRAVHVRRRPAVWQHQHRRPLRAPVEGNLPGRTADLLQLRREQHGGHVRQ